MSALNARKRRARNAVVGIVLFTMRDRRGIFAIGVFRLVVDLDVFRSHDGSLHVWQAGKELY